MSRKIFVNLPVRDLPRTKSFFAALGFEFDARFSDDKGACMVLSEEGYVMLLTRERFAEFTKRPVGDATQQTSGIFALSCTSRAEVDELLKKAIAAGGTTAGDAMDHGFMYLCRFYDLDGHHWEIFWMDAAAIPSA